MKRKFFALFFIFLIYSCAPPAKNPTIREEVKNSTTENMKLGVKEYKNGNYPSSRMFFEEALKQAYLIDNTSEIVNILINLCEINLRLENYTEASNQIFSARYIAKKENIYEHNFMLNLTIGRYYEKAYKNEKGYELALDFYLKALNEAKEDTDRAIVYSNIGLVKIRTDQLREAKNWIEKARAINESRQIYTALGDNYFYLGEIFEKQNNYDIAIKNYLLALKYDKIAEKTMAILEDLKRIALLYSKMNMEEDAIFYFEKAYKVAEGLNIATEKAFIQEKIENLKQKTSGKL